MRAKRLLILGGTAEAASLADRAVATFETRLEVVTSLAGRTTSARHPAGQMRIGGFGGTDGLAAFIAGAGIDLVVDATHPFAATISQHAAIACERLGVPRLALLRPPWPRESGDRWREAASMEDAAALLAKRARRAFLTTGPGSLKAFMGLDRVWLLVRLIEPPTAPLPLARHEVVIARPPFELAGERRLLEHHRIDTLVTKQSGGAGAAKLIAAREAGLEVVMVRRPPPPAGKRVTTVDEAIAWLATRL